MRTLLHVAACLLLVLSVAKRLRRSRVGRVMIGVRENDRAAQAFGVSPVRASTRARWISPSRTSSTS